MTLVVTGGAGFIGSALIRNLVQDTDEQIVNLDKLTYAGDPSTVAEVSGSKRYAFEQVDICDADGVARVFATHKPRAIIHLAAESHVDRSIDGPGAFIQTNVVGTYTLLHEARRYWETLKGEEHDTFRFVHVSTDEVYGSLEADDPPFTERNRYEPNSPYAASKAGADHLARAWFHTYGLPVVTTNCSNNYGPYQFPEKLIPVIILNALDGKPLPIYGDGGQIRDWLFVGDHVSALRRALGEGRPGETYAIGGRSERKNLELVKLLCSLLDELAPSQEGSYSRLITYVTDRPGHDRRYAIDPSKVSSELGWEPSETLESGLRKTVEWYLAHREWCEHIRKAKNYSGQRLGLKK